MVSGLASVVLDDGVERTIALSAATQRDGSAAGTIEFNDPAPMADQDVDGTGDAALAESKSGVTVSAEVTCLFVAEHAAIVAGDVVKAEPARYVGKQIMVFLTDSERSRPVMSWGLYEPGAENHLRQLPVRGLCPGPDRGRSYRSEAVADQS